MKQKKLMWGGDVHESKIHEKSKNPDYTEVQSDGRIRKWKKIREEGKFLRIILLPDGETIHNAFFDRGFKGGLK